MKLSNLIVVVCIIILLLFSLQIHTPLAGASTTSGFLEDIREQEEISGKIEFFSYPRLTNINGWARDTCFMQYFNRNTNHVIILHLNDNLFADKVEFRQYGSLVGTIPDYVAFDALAKLRYTPIPISYGTSETVQIDSNGSAIFRSEEIRNVIPKIQFFPGSFGNVMVNMLDSSTTSPFTILDIEVSENLKYSPAIITFQVEKKWLEKRSAKKDDVELYRKGYSGWVGLRAQWTVTEGDYEQYVADTPGFSVFKIDIEDAMVLYSLKQSFADALFIVSIFSIFAGAVSIIVYWYVRRRRG